MKYQADWSIGHELDALANKTIEGVLPDNSRIELVTLRIVQFASPTRSTYQFQQIQRRHVLRGRSEVLRPQADIGRRVSDHATNLLRQTRWRARITSRNQLYYRPKRGRQNPSHFPRIDGIGLRAGPPVRLRKTSLPKSY